MILKLCPWGPENPPETRRRARRGLSRGHSSPQVTQSCQGFPWELEKIHMGLKSFTAKFDKPGLQSAHFKSTSRQCLHVKIMNIKDPRPTGPELGWGFHSPSPRALLPDPPTGELRYGEHFTGRHPNPGPRYFCLPAEGWLISYLARTQPFCGPSRPQPLESLLYRLAELWVITVQGAPPRALPSQAPRNCEPGCGCGPRLVSSSPSTRRGAVTTTQSTFPGQSKAIPPLTLLTMPEKRCMSKHAECQQAAAWPPLPLGFLWGNRSFK